MVLFVLRDLFAKQLRSVPVDAAHLPASASVSVGQLLTCGVVAELKELSPSAGASVGVPSFNGHAGRSEVPADVDG